MINAIIGMLLSVHSTSDGTTVFTLDAPYHPYQTIEECLSDAKEVNKDASIPYLLVCIPNLNQEDLNPPETSTPKIES